MTITIRHTLDDGRLSNADLWMAEGRLRIAECRVGAKTMMQRTMVAMMAIGVGCSAVSLHAQETRQNSRHVPPAVLEAQELLVAAYTELREARVAWRIGATPTGAIVEARAAPQSFSELPTERAMVAATVVDDEQGRLQELRASGAPIYAVRQAARIGGSTPSVKFAPDNAEALDALVPAGIPARLGAPTVRERTFRTDRTIDEAQTWRVEIESTDVAPQRYTVVFEPVEGRLLSVVRR